MWNAAYSDSIYGGKESERVEKIESNCYYMVTISLAAAVAIGIIGRVYLFPTILGTEGNASTESVFIEMITKMFTKIRICHLSEESSCAAFWQRLCPQRIHSFW